MIRFDEQIFSDGLKPPSPKAAPWSGPEYRFLAEHFHHDP